MKKAIIGAVALAIGTLAGAGSASAAPSQWTFVVMGKDGCSAVYGVSEASFTGSYNPGGLPKSLKVECGSMAGKMTVSQYRGEPIPDLP